MGCNKQNKRPSNTSIFAYGLSGEQVRHRQFIHQAFYNVPQ